MGGVLLARRARTAAAVDPLSADPAGKAWRGGLAVMAAGSRLADPRCDDNERQG